LRGQPVLRAALPRHRRGPVRGQRLVRHQDRAAVHHHDHRQRLGESGFGRWLFAPAFFWEDVVSMLVLALHTACLVAMATGWLDARSQMLLALAAYTSYVINAAQFLLKLRAARLDSAPA
jgi:hypothetical protein